MSELRNDVLPAFQTFVDELRGIWSRETDTRRRMELGRDALERLVRDPELQAHSRTWPSTEGHKNLLLHSDDAHGFVVNAVVREPGRFGSVHDHADAWTAYGVCDGQEYLERFVRLDDGSQPERAEIERVSTTIGRAGVCDLVPPWAIHAEQGGGGRSAAVILRSQKLVGRVLQHRYDEKARSVTMGSGPTQIPFELRAG